jgi:hypothetical protein
MSLADTDPATNADPTRPRNPPPPRLSDRSVWADMGLHGFRWESMGVRRRLWTMMPPGEGQRGSRHKGLGAPAPRFDAVAQRTPRPSATAAPTCLADPPPKPWPARWLPNVRLAPLVARLSTDRLVCRTTRQPAVSPGANQACQQAQGGCAKEKPAPLRLVSGARSWFPLSAAVAYVALWMRLLDRSPDAPC